MKKKKKKKLKKKVVRKKKAVRKVKKKKVKKAARSIKRKKKVVAKAKKKSMLEKATAKGMSVEEVGVVTHYYPRVEAAVVKLTKGTLNVGDSIILKGHTTDFQEKIQSMQLDHVPITNATIGQEIGLKTKAQVRENDVVYKLL